MDASRWTACSSTGGRGCTDIPGPHHLDLNALGAGELRRAANLPMRPVALAVSGNPNDQLFMLYQSESRRGWGQEDGLASLQRRRARLFHP